jgi:hypothetical protein
MIELPQTKDSEEVDRLIRGLVVQGHLLQITVEARHRRPIRQEEAPLHSQYMVEAIRVCTSKVLRWAMVWAQDLIPECIIPVKGMGLPLANTLVLLHLTLIILTSPI